MTTPAPFMGETMTCVMCRTTEQSDPLVSSQWRLIQVDGQRYYACPQEFPTDGSPRRLFKKAYTRILARIARRSMR